MQLPNKLYPYEKSTLATLPVVLKIIKSGKTNVKDIFQSTLNSLDEPTDFYPLWTVFTLLMQLI